MYEVGILPDGTGEPIDALRQGNYLSALRMLSNLVHKTDFGSYIYYSYVLQALGQFAEAQATLQQQEALFPQQALQTCAIPQQQFGKQVSLADAPSLLEGAVKKHRVVMLGEEHHNSEHRAFGVQVLPLLVQAGMTHLAIETGFQQPLDSAMQTKRVTYSTDEFSYEPYRASLLRASIALHLPIVAFAMDEADRSVLRDNEGMWGEYRERRMAEHIIERILEQDTNARALVWAGYNHPRKHTYPGFLKRMAAWLWELTGEEPFSAYQQTSDEQQYGVDVVIRHPASNYTNGRPDWLRTKDRYSVNGIITPSATYLVQLHLVTEGALGTPIDQVLITDGVFELLVPVGEYLLRVWTLQEKVVKEQLFVVHSDSTILLSCPSVE